MKTAVIILGHGSRSKGASDAVQRVAAQIKKLGRYEIVEHAFLQYSSPTLNHMLERCARQKAGRIVIVPFFMQMGSHVRRDIPALMEKAKKQHPDIEITVTNYAGAHPLMVKIVMDLVDEKT